MKEIIRLSDHFTYKRLIKFVMPSIIMMVFISIYSVVDGLFVSNFVGKTALAAVNFIFPVSMICGGFGFMLGTGGTAMVAKTFGMGEKKLANEYFSFITIAIAVCGVILSAICIVIAEPLAKLLGAEGEMLEYAVIYCRITMLAMPFFMLQNSFQNFFITAEKPKLGLTVTVIAGVTNMILDALFVAVFKWGLVGAAVATSVSQMIGGVIPLIYFLCPNSSTLRLCRTPAYWKMLIGSCFNGFSELLSNISQSVVTILYNVQLLRFAGEDGVAAYGVIMYVAFVFIAIFIGFVIGSSPIVSFHFGDGNSDELKNMRKKSLTVVLVSGAAMVTIALLLSVPLCRLFVGYDSVLYKMTFRGFIIYAFSYLLTGFNIFGSSFFTALNNGGVSAVISFLRTLVFQIAAVMLLPEFMGLDGVWVSVVLVELVASGVTTAFLISKKKQYGY